MAPGVRMSLTPGLLLICLLAHAAAATGKVESLLAVEDGVQLDAEGCRPCYSPPCACGSKSFRYTTTVPAVTDFGQSSQDAPAAANAAGAAAGAGAALAAAAPSQPLAGSPFPAPAPVTITSPPAQQYGPRPDSAPRYNPPAVQLPDLSNLPAPAPFVASAASGPLYSAVYSFPANGAPSTAASTAAIPYDPTSSYRPLSNGDIQAMTNPTIVPLKMGSVVSFPAVETKEQYEARMKAQAERAALEAKRAAERGAKNDKRRRFAQINERRQKNFHPPPPIIKYLPGAPGQQVTVQGEEEYDIVHYGLTKPVVVEVQPATPKFELEAAEDTECVVDGKTGPCNVTAKGDPKVLFDIVVDTAEKPDVVVKGKGDDDDDEEEEGEKLKPRVGTEVNIGVPTIDVKDFAKVTHSPLETIAKSESE